jgi:hypothetical protein
VDSVINFGDPISEMLLLLSQNCGGISVLPLMGIVSGMVGLRMSRRRNPRS